MNTVRERFAALESEVEAVLRRQKTDPYIPVDQTATVIAGFAVVDPQRKSMIIEQIAQQITRYATAKAALLHEVRSLGVEPLATLPATAWHNVCRISKLHRPSIHTDRGGGSYVYVDAKSFSTLIERKSTTAFNIFAWLSIIGSPIAAYIHLWNSWFNTSTIEISDKILAAGAISALIFVCTLVAVLVFSGSIIKVFHRLVARYYLHIKWDKILNMILARNDVAMTIQLPNPPPDVQETLLKVRSLNPQVAAVAQAIRFPKLVKEAIGMIPEPVHADPIVYIEKNGVVVIVAQFGDFPIERNVIKRLSADEILN